MWLEFERWDVVYPLVSKESTLIFIGEGALLSSRREFKIFVVSKIASEVKCVFLEQEGEFVMWVSCDSSCA